MPAGRTRGFTLIELMIAIVITGIVGASMISLLVRSQRLSRTQADRSIMQANIRAGMALVSSELREININATESDISALSSTSITYRGQRAIGFVCDVAAGYIRITRATFSGYRGPIPTTDALMLFVENDPDDATDDGWLQRAITAVDAEACNNGDPGLKLTLGANLPTSPDTLAMIAIGSPVRTYEVMQIGALVQGGETWLAARSISAGQAFQPVLGPLSPGGVTFSYLTAAGTAGATALTARAIQLTLTGITDNIVAAGAGTNAWVRATDQLTTIVQLRNTP